MKKILQLTFALLVLCTVLVKAQGVTTSAINGTVADNRGETLPGATIVATHMPSGTVYSTVSRNDGRYNLPNLRVGGPYILKISFVGFKDFTVQNLTLTLGQDLNINAKLIESSNSLAEVVISGTEDKLFNNSRTGARETITRGQIDRLPTINRSLQDFTKLTPSANGNSFGGRSSSYNNVTVDGALFNNSFGLSGTLGGQTNSQPISLDAIEQIQVDIAPFDVRQGFFTGAGINTVTKSGTNSFKGSAYYFLRNPNTLGLDAGVYPVAKPVFKYYTQGLSLGGPIVKNKLFFFVSGEQERLNEPATSFTALKAGQAAGGSVSQAQASDLATLKDFLITKYGYNPGEFEGYNYLIQSDKLTTKLDWNINKNNTLSAKYFYLKSSRDLPASNSGAISNGSRQPSATGMPFNGSGYTINNNFNIGVVELNSRIGTKFSNKLTFGYSALRDIRSSQAQGLFPLVDIGNGSGQTLTAFGYEPFTAFNQLDTDTWQFANDFTIYAGKHEIVIGTSNQINAFKNGFAPTYYGNYNFATLADFYDSANNGTAKASRYQLRYSALPDGSFPFAKIKAKTFSFYVQDKFQATQNLKLTYALRADLASFPVTLDKNADLANLTFRDNLKIDVSKLPDSKILWAPRFGFNWDAKGDQTLQIRGGAGVFTGQVPFVWVSNQASNNGVQFGSVDIGASSSAADKANYFVFKSDVNANRPVGAAANTSYNVAVTDKDFKYPQIFRTNLAFDKKLAGGVVLTLEGAYTKDINGVYHQNINLPSTGTALVGSDTRLRYISSKIYSGAGGATLQNPNLSDVILMKNTKKGYSYFITAQLQKNFANGLTASVAYTKGKSMSVNDGGSIAQSIWRDRSVSGDPNADELGYSNFYLPNRVISYLSYRKEYAKNYATSFGLTFEAAPAGNYSHTYVGDLNNDGQTNDLMYIPKDASDINLVVDGAWDLRTPTQIWAQLDAFIKQDPYLSKHRGEVVKRGAGILPYFTSVNMNFTQDIFVNVKGQKNTLRFTADILNVGNLLNKNWGLLKQLGAGARQPLSYKGLVTAAGDPNLGEPTFSFPFADRTNLVPVSQSFVVNTAQASRWQVQLGFRYLFN
jgi:hypothetical protein